MYSNHGGSWLLIHRVLDTENGGVCNALEGHGELDREAFHLVYTSISPAVFGSITRIVGLGPSAELALTDVFVCLHAQGAMNNGNPLGMAVLLPLVFECAAKALKAVLSDQEIEARIDAERKRLMQGIRRDVPKVIVADGVRL